MIKLRTRVVRAVNKFIHERQNKRLLERLNRVYIHDPDQPERELVKQMKARLRRIFEEKW